MQAATIDQSKYLSDKYFLKLEDIRKNSGDSDTAGLANSEIFNFLSMDSTLKEAIDQAHDYHISLRVNLCSEI